jgi:hypothetical protein
MDPFQLPKKPPGGGYEAAPRPIDPNPYLGFLEKERELTRKRFESQGITPATFDPETQRFGDEFFLFSIDYQKRRTAVEQEAPSLTPKGGGGLRTDYYFAFGNPLPAASVPPDTGAGDFSGATGAGGSFDPTPEELARERARLLEIVGTFDPQRLIARLFIAGITPDNLTDPRFANDPFYNALIGRFLDLRQRGLVEFNSADPSGFGVTDAYRLSGSLTLPVIGGAGGAVVSGNGQVVDGAFRIDRGGPPLPGAGQPVIEVPDKPATPPGNNQPVIGPDGKPELPAVPGAGFPDNFFRRNAADP